MAMKLGRDCKWTDIIGHVFGFLNLTELELRLGLVIGEG